MEQFLKSLSEKAKQSSISIPQNIEDCRDEFNCFDDLTFTEIVKTYNDFDESGKKSFYLDYKMAKNNMEYYQEFKKEDNFYNCPICKNTLVVHSIDFYNDRTGHYFHNKKSCCKCNQIRKSLDLMKKNGLLGLIQKKSFSNFKAVSDFQKSMKMKAINFVRAMIANKKVSYFVGGQSGSGKTHICSAMLAELVNNGICVHFFNYIQDIATLNRYQFSSENREEFNNLLTLYKQADILYFDDFMYGDVTMSEQKIIFNIINHRYENDLPCIISSEKTIVDIKKINISIFGRLYEMCRDFMININKDDSKNYREYAV